MRRFATAEHVAVIEADDAIFVARLPDGPIIRLSGTAAIAWTAALEHGDTLVSHVAKVMELPEADIASDIDAFIADLVERRLLVSDGDERYWTGCSRQEG